MEVVKLQEAILINSDLAMYHPHGPTSHALPLAFCPPSQAPVPSTDPLTCAVDDSTHGIPYRDNLQDYQYLTRPKFACWYSHVSAIMQFVRSGRGPAALIMEDDIDMEVDIRARLDGLWDALPEDWDMVWLGERCP